MLDLSLPNLYRRITALEQRSQLHLNWRGVWSSGLVYDPYDVVSTGGVTYLSLKSGFNHTPNANPAYWTPIPGLGVAGPRCIKTLGNGNFLLNVGNAGAAVPVNTAEVDNDNMGLTAGRITIVTPGRYVLVAYGFVYVGNAAGNYGVYMTKNGSLNPGGATSPGYFGNGYTNAGAYSNGFSFVIDDLIAGDYITMTAITWTAALTVNFHYNGTYLAAWMVG
jgi:hypothetical protein